MIGGGKPAKGYQEPKNQMPKITRVSDNASTRSVEKSVNSQVADSAPLHRR